MNLTRMMTDKVFFEDRKGHRIGPFKTKFGTDRITVFQDELGVTEGDRVIQPLPDGTEQAYVAEAIAHGAARRNIPAHFIISIAREAASPERGAAAPFTAAGMQGAAAGADNNDANIPALLQSLAERIDNSDFPVEQKDEARRLLQTFIAHPVVAGLLKTA